MIVPIAIGLSAIGLYFAGTKKDPALYSRDAYGWTQMPKFPNVEYFFVGDRAILAREMDPGSNSWRYHTGIYDPNADGL